LARKAERCRLGSHQPALPPHGHCDPLHQPQLDRANGAERRLQISDQFLEFGRILVLKKQSRAEKAVLCRVLACDGLAVLALRPGTAFRIFAVGRELSL
jgi:hypothetical protein